MTGVYKPYDGDTDELLKAIVSQNDLMISLLTKVVDGLHRVELQLEKITNEPIDEDEQEIY